MTSTLNDLTGYRRITGEKSRKKQEDFTTLLGLIGERGLRLEIFNQWPEDEILEEKYSVPHH